MKKLGFLTLAVGLLTLASCKKDRTCRCVDSDDGSTELINIPNASKSDAKDICDSNDAVHSSYKTECELD